VVCFYGVGWKVVYMIWGRDLVMWRVIVHGGGWRQQVGRFVLVFDRESYQRSLFSMTLFNDVLLNGVNWKIE